MFEHQKSLISKYNQKAMYFLTFPINISKTADMYSIDRIIAICAAKEVIYVDNFSSGSCDILREINFSDIDELISEEEMNLLVLQLKHNLYKLSYIDYIYKYEYDLISKARECDFSNSKDLSNILISIENTLKMKCNNYISFFSDATLRSATLSKKEKQDIIIKYIEYEIANMKSTYITITLAVTVEHIEDLDLNNITVSNINFDNTEIINVIDYCMIDCV